MTKRVMQYVLIACAVFCMLNVVGWFAFLTYKNHGQPTFSFSENPAGPLPEKKAWYLAHKNEYDALFLGDSRTLCGMHPDFIDPVWGKRSYNLSHWATWMPMQYALISDIVNDIPRNTIVVWSIGHQNFTKQTIRATYPIGWARIPGMAVHGYPLGELVQAQLAFTPVAALVGRNEEFFNHFEALMDRAVLTPQARAASSSVSQKPDRTLQSLQDNKLTSYLEPWHDDEGRLVSVGQYKINGAMARVEIVPEFYREKQDKKDFGGYTPEGFIADAPSMESFKTIVAAFDKAGVTLVVNEIEETPYMYKDKAAQRGFRTWMRENIKPVVEAHGFKYIHADEANLSDADYFDYNHLNEQGAKRFDRVVARKFKEVAP